MATVFLDMAMSLDGFVSGPDGGDAGLHVAPVILGGGLRLVDGVGPVWLEQTQVLASPGATHL